MQNNPFTSIEQKLTRLEALILEFGRSKTDHNQDIRPDLMSVQQASGFLGLAVQTIYGKVSKREIPFSKRGGKLWFSQKALEEWVHQGQKHTVNRSVYRSSASVK